MVDPISATAGASVAMLMGLKAACAAHAVHAGVPVLGKIVFAFLTGGKSAAVSAAYNSGVPGLASVVRSFF